MKRILLTLFFLFIFIILFFIIMNTINGKKYVYNFNAFYKEKKNIDVFFVGSSRIYYTISPMEIWDKYGIISYDRGSSGQFYKHSYLFMEEIFKLHKPKLIVFDIGTFTTQYRTNLINFILSTLPNNFTKIKFYYDFYGLSPEFYTNINIYSLFHTRWKELNMFDFTDENFWKGRYSGSYVNGYRWDKLHLINQQKKNIYSTYDTIKFNNDVLIYAKKMVKLAKDNNAQILFINMPHSIGKISYSHSRTFAEVAKENNFNFIDYNIMYNELNLDFNKDFRDYSHINLYGSRKVMDHLIPYIIEHYNIPNRKNDPLYASWNEDYIKYARAINREEIRELKSFAEWKKLAFYDNYTVMLSANDDVLRKLPEKLKNDLKSFGLKKYNTDKPNMRYAAIIDDNKVFFEEASNKPVTYKGRMKNIVNLLITSNGGAVINVSGKPRSKNKYGLNFVIYDKVNREIVDSIWIDPNKPYVVRR